MKYFNFIKYMSDTYELRWNFQHIWVKNISVKNIVEVIILRYSVSY